MKEGVEKGKSPVSLIKKDYGYSSPFKKDDSIFMTKRV